HAKNAAQRTACLNKLKQWCLAQTMFAQDNNDTIPRECAVPGGSTLEFWANVASAGSADVWYNALPSSLGLRPASSYNPSDKIKFYDEGSLFHCPTARINNNPGIVQNGPYAYFSIAMNSKLIQGSDTTIRVASIKRPSQTVFFVENRLEGEPMIDPQQAT